MESIRCKRESIQCRRKSIRCRRESIRCRTRAVTASFLMAEKNPDWWKRKVPTDGRKKSQLMEEKNPNHDSHSKRESIRCRRENIQYRKESIRCRRESIRCRNRAVKASFLMAEKNPGWWKRKVLTDGRKNLNWWKRKIPMSLSCAIGHGWSRNIYFLGWLSGSTPLMIQITIACS